MRKSTKLFKKLVALFLIVLMSIESFAAIVSDNDGSAFITKAEFDSMKNDFQSQLNKYNQEIDAKIDNAINGYLTGVKNDKQVKLINLYKSINPTWMKNKRFNKSRKGTKFTEYISVCYGTVTSYGSNRWDMRSMYFEEGTSEVWYLPTSIVKNSSSQERLYQIVKKDVGSFANQYCLNDIVESNYSVNITGSAMGSRVSSNYGSDTMYYWIPSDIYFKRASATTFGTYYKDIQINVYNSGSFQYDGVTESAAVVWAYEDTPYSDSTLWCLCGGKLEDDTMYLLDQAKIANFGEYFAVASANMGLTRHFSDSGSVVDKTTLDSSYTCKLNSYVYRHELIELAAPNLIHEEITRLMNKQYGWYSGCPLFTSSNSEGVVKFKLKFTNTAGAQTKWALNSDAFANTANPQNCGNIENCSETVFLANSGATIEVNFDVESSTTYWIKVEPVSGYTTLEIVGDIIQTNR